MVRFLLWPSVLTVYVCIVLCCLHGQKVLWTDVATTTASILVITLFIQHISKEKKHEKKEAFTPPDFSEIVRKSEDTLPKSSTQGGATRDDKDKLHNSNDRYDFLSTAEYGEKDPLYYANTGDLIDRSWREKYTILDTKHWKPYTAPPPVCLDRESPCPPCPVVMHTPYLDLSLFHKTKAIIPNRA